MSNSQRNYYAEQVQIINEFFADPETGVVSQEGLELAAEASAFDAQLTAILNEFDTQGFGLTLTNTRRDSWVIVIADASEPGKFRYQSFRAIGWTGHATFDTPDKAIIDAFQSGYRLLAERDTLDRLASTAEWARGTEQLDLISKHNAGSMTFERFNEAMREVAVKYGQPA
jgi:hypothetical protein